MTIDFAAWAKKVQEVAKLSAKEVTGELVAGLSPMPGARVVLRIPHDREKMTDAYGQPFDDLVFGLAIRLETETHARKSHMEWSRAWVAALINRGALAESLKQLYVTALFSEKRHIGRPPNGVVCVRRPAYLEPAISGFSSPGELLCFIDNDVFLAAAGDAVKVVPRRRDDGSVV